MVKVLIFSVTLRNALGEHEIEVELKEPTTVRKLIESYPDQLRPLLPYMMNREVLIMVNKKVSADDSVVKDGDIVKLSYQGKSSYDGVRDIPT